MTEACIWSSRLTFDTVLHQNLLSALAEIACTNQALTWFPSYLSYQTQTVLQTNVTIEWKAVCRGVLQGSGISPKTLNIYAR